MDKKPTWLEPASVDQVNKKMREDIAQQEGPEFIKVQGPPAAVAKSRCFSSAAESVHCRREFDELNSSILTRRFVSRPVRKGLSVPAIAEDIRSYMIFFNMRFKKTGEKFHRQLPCAHRKKGALGS